MHDRCVQIVQHDFFSADVVLACDCIWLMDILEPFVDTLAALCKGPSRPTAFVTYEGDDGIACATRLPLACVALSV